MLTGVSLTCFLFSYLLVLALEFARLFVRIPGRRAVVLLGMLAGLLAHSIFLGNELFGEGTERLLGSWFQWVILAAWGLALACTLLMLRNPQGHLGLFLIPLVLALIGLSIVVRENRPFATEATVDLWGKMHGISLLLGTMFICQGFAFGIMYLVQSHRLKSKRKRRGLIRLPALEFLQSMNRFNLYAAALTLGVGLCSGVLLNFARDGRVAWLSGGVLVSIALLPGWRRRPCGNWPPRVRWVGGGVPI